MPTYRTIIRSFSGYVKGIMRSPCQGSVLDNSVGTLVLVPRRVCASRSRDSLPAQAKTRLVASPGRGTRNSVLPEYH